MGNYRRAGILFTASAPTLLDEVPEAVLTDPWLIVTEADPEKIKAAAQQKIDVEDLLAQIDHLQKQLEGLVADAQRDIQTLNEKDSRISELTAALAGKEAELIESKKSFDAAVAEIKSLRKQIQKAGSSE